MVTRVPAPAAGMRATPMGTIEPARRPPPPPPEWRPSRKIGRQRRRPAAWAGWSAAARAAVDERGPGALPAVLRGLMGILPAKCLTRALGASRKVAAGTTTGE